MIRRFLYVTLFAFLLVSSGCKLGPGTMSDSEFMPGENAVSSVNPFSEPVTDLRPHAETSSFANPDVAHLAQQLKSDDTDVRTAACQQLGAMASETNVGAYGAIELLSQTMHSDPNMDVRIAATNAMSGIEDLSASERIDELMQDRNDEFDQPARFSLLKKLWR